MEENNKKIKKQKQIRKSEETKNNQKRKSTVKKVKGQGGRRDGKQGGNKVSRTRIQEGEKLKTKQGERKRYARGMTEELKEDKEREGRAGGKLIREEIVKREKKVRNKRSKREERLIERKTPDAK